MPTVTHHTGEILEWSVNTPALLKEIGNHNPQLAILGKPLTIFAGILAEVGERAAQLNDPILNGLMCRLAIYSIADQYSPDYNKRQVTKVLKSYKEAKKNNQQ